MKSVVNSVCQENIRQVSARTKTVLTVITAVVPATMKITNSSRDIKYDFVGGDCSKEAAPAAGNADAELVANITKQVMAQLGLK